MEKPLKYPKKSHRKHIKIPRESSKLAEFFGIEFGDGSIDKWQMKIYLNSIKDKTYAQFIKKLIKDLFNLESKEIKRKDSNTLILTTSSMNLIEYLLSKGAVKGDKIKQSLSMPQWIKGKADYKKSFVRGLIDTDGCTYIHRHTTNGIKYNNIGLCFTNMAEDLVKSVYKILKKLNIKCYLRENNHRLYIYDQNHVKRYLKQIGSSNPRITGTYKKWRGARVVE